MRRHAPWSVAIVGFGSLLALACQQSPTPSNDHDAGDPGADPGADPVAGDAPAPPGDGAGGDPQAAWAPFAVISLNLHCLKQDGTTFADVPTRFAAIAAAVQAEGVKALVVQEACVTPSTDAMVLLATALEEATGLTWSRTWVFAHVAWAGTGDEADEGVGVLAAGALSDRQSLTYFSQGAMARVAAGVRLPPSLGGLALWSTHLDLDSATVRAAQARQAAAAFVTLSAPALDVVMGGDFNDTSGSATCLAMQSYGYTHLTGSLGSTLIDHLYAHRGAALQVLSTRLIFDGAPYPAVSDHPGVLAVLAPAPPAAVTQTRIDATIDVGFGSFVSVRGDTAPLSWDAGWPGVAVAADHWSLVLTEVSQGQGFAYKCLRNDVDYQTGANVAGTGGQTNLDSPSF